MTWRFSGIAPAMRRARKRSSQFGTAYLRLDRDLEPGMVVTISLGSTSCRRSLRGQPSGSSSPDWWTSSAPRACSALAGSGSKDHILVTEHGPENISSAIPKALDQIEQER